MSDANVSPHRQGQVVAETAESQPPESLHGRAVHLAAHAVATVVCGGTYGTLTLDDTSACQFAPASDLGGGGPARNAMEAAIIVALAGGEAESLLTGTAPRACADVKRWLTDGDPAEAEPYVEWLRLKAARAVAHPLRQRLIIALARRLHLGPLSAVEVMRITDLETSRYMRGQ